MTPRMAYIAFIGNGHVHSLYLRTLWYNIDTKWWPTYITLLGNGHVHSLYLRTMWNSLDTKDGLYYLELILTPIQA